MSLRDRIKSAEGSKPSRSEVIAIPEWDGVELEIIPMKTGQRLRIMDTCYDKDGRAINVRLYPELLIICTRDPATHEPVWRKADADDILTYDPDVVQKIVDACLRVSGLNKEGQEEGKECSDETPNSTSSSLSLAS